MDHKGIEFKNSLDSFGSGLLYTHSNEPHNSTKYAIFFDQLSDYQLLKEDVAPWTQSMSESNSQSCPSHIPVKMPDMSYCHSTEMWQFCSSGKQCAIQHPQCTTANSCETLRKLDSTYNTFK